jgi:hypothetical protein
MRPAQGGVGVLAGDALADQAEQEQVVVGAAGDHVETALHEHLGHGPGVVDDLLLVSLEARLQRFLEAHRLGRDHMHQRPALPAREHRRVEFLFEVRVALGQDQAAARPRRVLWVVVVTTSA